MRCQRIVPFVLVFVVAALCLGSFASVASALIICTGTQSLTDPADGDSCSTAAEAAASPRRRRTAIPPRPPLPEEPAPRARRLPTSGWPGAGAQSSPTRRLMPPIIRTAGPSASKGSSSESNATDFSCASACANGKASAQANADGSSTAQSIATGYSNSREPGEWRKFSSGQGIRRTATPMWIAENGGSASAQAINNSNPTRRT